MYPVGTINIDKPVRTARGQRRRLRRIGRKSRPRAHYLPAPGLLFGCKKKETDKRRKEKKNRQRTRTLKYKTESDFTPRLAEKFSLLPKLPPSPSSNRAALTYTHIQHLHSSGAPLIPKDTLDCSREKEGEREQVEAPELLCSVHSPRLAQNAETAEVRDSPVTSG